MSVTSSCRRIACLRVLQHGLRVGADLLLNHREGLRLRGAVVLHRGADDPAGVGDEVGNDKDASIVKDALGASRERVNKAISSFLRLGWIEQQDRSYKILKRRELEIRSK